MLIVQLFKNNRGIKKEEFESILKIKYYRHSNKMMIYYIDGKIKEKCFCSLSDRRYYGTHPKYKIIDKSIWR
jgi:hypothetical protein